MFLELFFVKFSYQSIKRPILSRGSLLFSILLLFVSGCDLISPKEARREPKSEAKRGAKGSIRSPLQAQKFPAVDVAIARLGSLAKNTQFVGTTLPIQEVSLRSRVEGQILELNVGVGDRVTKGQILARIDDSLNKASVLEAEAELAALRSEVISLQADASEGLTQINQAKIVLQQAESDLIRSNQLFQEGAVTEQSTEQARNAVDNARQALAAAEQQVANRTSSVVAAQRRVAAGQAIVAQEQQRKSFTLLTSPVTGSVVAKALEQGDLAQVGDQVLQLGDFNQIKVQVQISELALSKIQIGQLAQVQLDAFPGQSFNGKVSRISLAADDTARLIPVEVTIPKLDERIGRGLLARVSFTQQKQERIIVPESAIQTQSAQIQSAQAKKGQIKKIDPEPGNRATIFVIQEGVDQVKVEAREVMIGDRANFQVEIISGLKPGERFVVKSSGKLKDGFPVRLSFLSES